VARGESKEEDAEEEEDDEVMKISRNTDNAQRHQVPNGLIVVRGEKTTS